jgi:hypothetical protein
MAMRRRARLLLWSAVAALLLSSVVGLLCRDAIASFAARRAFARRGLRCSPVSVHVPLALPPSPIELEATRCEATKGPLESVLFKEPLRVHLGRLKIRSLTCASLEINLRPRAHREVELNALGDMTRLAGLDEPAVELMFDSAALSRERVPPLLATHAVVRRAGKPIAECHDLRVSRSGAGMTVSSPRAHVDQAPLLGEGSLQLTASPTAAAATVVFSGNMKVRVVLEHIDGAKPKVDFSIAVGSAKGD